MFLFIFYGIWLILQRLVVTNSIINIAHNMKYLYLPDSSDVQNEISQGITLDGITSLIVAKKKMKVAKIILAPNTYYKRMMILKSNCKLNKYKVNFERIIIILLALMSIIIKTYILSVH